MRGRLILGQLLCCTIVRTVGSCWISESYVPGAPRGRQRPGDRPRSINEHRVVARPA